MKRRFYVTFEMESEVIGRGVIELDQRVIDAVDDEWHDMITDSINTPEEIAQFIAFNMVINHANLNSIDGFADLTNDLAIMIEWPEGLDNYDVIAKEIPHRTGAGW